MKKHLKWKVSFPEYEADTKVSPGLAIKMFGCLGAFFTLATNSVALMTMKKVMKTTFLNLLITLDCCVGITMFPFLLIFADILVIKPSPLYCSLRVFVPFFLIMMNGLLSVGIVIFRVIHVCKPRWVMTANQRTFLNYSILVFIFGIDILLTVGAFYYKTSYSHYQLCIGQLDQIHGGLRWDLPILNPFHLMSIFVFVSRTILVPLGYTLIFNFRNNTTEKAKGLSESSRAYRRMRNIVNAKFNCYIWLSEMSSYIGLLFASKTSSLIYAFTSFGVTPLLYLAGMEETRVELFSLV